MDSGADTGIVPAMLAATLPFLCTLLPADDASQDGAARSVLVLDEEPQDARAESRVPS